MSSAVDWYHLEWDMDLQLKWKKIEKHRMERSATEAHQVLHVLHKTPPCKGGAWYMVHFLPPATNWFHSNDLAALNFGHKIEMSA